MVSDPSSTINTEFELDIHVGYIHGEKGGSGLLYSRNFKCTSPLSCGTVDYG